MGFRQSSEVWSSFFGRDSDLNLFGKIIMGPFMLIPCVIVSFFMLCIKE